MGDKIKDTVSSTFKLAKQLELKEFLLWKRCIFMTHEQYIKKEHINTKIHYRIGYTKDIKSFISNHIKEIAPNMPHKKVPLPIYVIISKHLEYDDADTILQMECKDDLINVINDTKRYGEYKKAYDKPELLGEKPYNSFNNYCYKKKSGELLNDDDLQKKAFIYKNLNQDNIELLKGSSISSFKFKGTYEVIIYIPNLSKDFRYFPSFFEYGSQNRWMNLLINKDSKFLNVIPFRKNYEQKIIDVIGKKKYDENVFYKSIINNLNNKDGEQYPLIKDLTNICYDMGCTSQYGEDLEDIVPSVSKEYDTQLTNAKGKGPYYPTKCLRTNYYGKHMVTMSDDDKSELYDKILNEMNDFKNNYENIEKGVEPDKSSSTNIVDLLKGTAARFRNEKYTDYSENYNRKILSELAFRKNAYPGVQEIVLSAFRIKDDFLSEYTQFMPWGNILIDKDYVINDGDLIDIENTSIKSFNKQYEIKLDSNAKLSLFSNGVKKRTIIDFSMSNYKKITIAFENGNINLYGYDSYDHNDNRYSQYVGTSNAIGPLSIIIENDGNINVYENGFNVINKV
jgi:hypothetical protein